MTYVEEGGFVWTLEYVRHVTLESNGMALHGSKTLVGIYVSITT